MQKDKALDELLKSHTHTTQKIFRPGNEARRVTT